MRQAFLIGVAVVLAACTSTPDSVSTTVASTTSPSPPGTTATSTTSTTTTSPEPSTTVGEPATTTSTVPLAGLTYTVVAEGLDFPMLIMPWTDDESLIGFRDGRIHRFDGSEIDPEPLVDLAVSTDGERGLLGFDSAGASTVFVHYSDPSGDTTVSEIDLESGQERILLQVDQPASNHNGGMLQFGPDGMLYLGLGDGGGANDRFGHGQNTDTLLGGIVRIDPDSGEAELWSYGLRNPYRFWIDGDRIYIGDVGQNAFEEIDVVEIVHPGYNFGWPITEGLACFSPRSGCETDGLTLPVVEYAHADGGVCAVTGGVVYRGTRVPELVGHYFYSDFCGGWLRSLRYDGAAAVDQRDWTEDVGVPGRVVSFGVDHEGEVYVLTRDAIRRIDPRR
ncbi:MAG: PQQ-dependent sugar dehydrogenase [Acidimicrobiia bacterium]|nr:PQQ-dependent sugar dehydrogenase [Acidimicrobiia bacterium]